jgi:NADH oxidase (H2O2-forming)
LTRVVIIGHESAGFTAASTARAIDKQAKITVIERRQYPLYHICDIPFAISGELPNIEVLIENTKPPSIDIKLGTEAKSIDPDRKIVEIIELKSGKTENLTYDSLIIATGGYASRPPIKGIDLGGVHVVRTIEDGEAIIQATKRAKQAVIVGGGAIGVETSAALRRRGLEVLLVELMPYLLPAMLDQDMAELVDQRLQKEGIHVLCAQQLREIRGYKNVRSVVVGEKEYPADLVIMAVGVKPEVRLAKEAGIELGPTGGIKVDRYLRTSVPEIFAAGDCAETQNLITEEPTLPQLATTSIRMGKVAGENAVGGKAMFNGTFNTIVTSVHELIIASTGLTTSVAKKAGIDVVSARVRLSSRPHFYPGAEPIYVKLLVETGEHKIIGGQVIGTGGVAERVNLLALAIQKGMRVDELADIEYCYMPAVCDAVEPLTVAAGVVLRKL